MKRLITILSLAFLTGCSFTRLKINPDTRDIDTSWIKPGTTTRQEVAKRLGLPPSMHGVKGVGKNSFRWVSGDVFIGKFEFGYIVTPTFERGKEYYDEDIMVTFNKKDVVTLVSRVRSDGEEIRVIEWREWIDE